MPICRVGPVEWCLGLAGVLDGSMRLDAVSRWQLPGQRSPSPVTKPLMVSRTTIEYPLSSGPFDKSCGQDATSAALASKLLRGSFAMCLSLTHARRETMPKERVR